MTVNLNGVDIQVERIGTNGDMEKARQMYRDFDDKVDAVGVDLYLRLDKKEYPLHAALKLVSGIKQTPFCDERGLKLASNVVSSN